MCALGDDGFVVAVTEKSLFVVAPGKVVAQVDAGFRASCVACSPSGAQIAIGGQEGEIQLFEYAGAKLGRLPNGGKRHQGEVTALAFSPTGAHLGSCDAARHVYAWELPSFTPVSTSWAAHKAKVTTLAWSPSGRLLATGGVDSSLVLWSVDAPDESVTTRLAHTDGVTAVGFLSDELIISAGQVCARAAARAARRAQRLSARARVRAPLAGRVHQDVGHSEMSGA